MHACMTSESQVFVLQCSGLQRRIKMMVEKIEKFNQFGTMEGATAIGTKHFASMKQDVLDLCESRYDAKIRKYCEEQPVEVSVIGLVH